MIRAFVLDGLILLTEVKIVESTYLCYHELLLWLLQTTAEMVGNLVMAYVYVISSLVGNISYGKCAVIQDVCYGSRMKERGWQRNNCTSERRGYW